MKVSLQRVYMECLELMLKPMVKLTLRCGLGYSEFAGALKRVFIDVASDEFGVRGRPANASKIAAKTGLPRKTVSTYRAKQAQESWSPDDEATPINTIIHYWRYDPRFCERPGVARALSVDESSDFSLLVRSYAGDIPASTIKQELLRDGIVELTNANKLRLLKDFSFPSHLGEDFLRNAAFAIGNHSKTIVHNASLLENLGISEVQRADQAWFERIAWSRRMTNSDIALFQAWVREEGDTFIKSADAFISDHEQLGESAGTEADQTTGVGVFFFGA